MNGAVEILRGGHLESRHIVHVVVAHARRGVIAHCGNPNHVSFVRSAIKMFQALPLAEDGVVDALGMTAEEIALCTASHNAESFHVDAARSILRKAGNDEQALACGPHPPMHDPSAAALDRHGTSPGRIHNNCSGKHAGMLALARHHGWTTDGYHLSSHPVQRRVVQTLAAWTGVDVASIADAVDGCGLPTFALPLDRVALACARFAASEEPAPAIIRDAMTAHPEYVAGTGRLCTALMTAARGTLFAKVGAEGYYCAGLPDRQLGIALKVEDGAKRASEPALLAVLRALDVPLPSDALRPFSHPVVTNTRGEVVGQVRARIELHALPDTST